MKCIDTATRTNLSLELFRGFKERKSERAIEKVLHDVTCLYCRTRWIDFSTLTANMLK